jgi:glycosyltransferase involved in cell wall biosynthesis
MGATMSSGNEPARSTERVLLDCTGRSTTDGTDWHAGIRRVVHNVVAQSGVVGRQLSVSCRPVLRIGDRYAAAVPRVSWRGASWLEDRPSRPFSLRSLVCQVRQWRLSRRGETIVPGPGDTLVLMDAWRSQHAWPPVARARRNGAVVGVVLYDMLPITHPQYSPANVRELFTASLRIALEQADFFIAISDVVRGTLSEYAAQHGPRRWRDGGRVLSFCPGSALDLSGRQGIVRSAVRTVFASPVPEAPYLTVGTIEPRRNHRLVLDAFDLVWKRFPEASWCVVGRAGWLCEEVLSRIRHHPRYNRQLHLLHDLTDSELEHGYRRAKALICPSRAEGFGFPVVEALQYGLPVLASDIPVHREAGGNCCTYFHPRRPAELADLIGNIEATGTFPPVSAPDARTGLSWQDSTHDFLSKCLTASRTWDTAPKAA